MAALHAATGNRNLIIGPQGWMMANNNNNTVNDDSSIIQLKDEEDLIPIPLLINVHGM